MKSSMTNCMLDGKSCGYKIVVKMIIVRVHGAHLLNCVVFKHTSIFTRFRNTW